MPTVSWADHAVHVLRLVGELYKRTEFTDCSLDTEGGLIHGHKIILAASSPYLQKLFRDHHGMKIIPLKEVHYKDMKLILDLIYCGETYVPVIDMGYFRQLAELLQMSPLQCAYQNISDTFSTNDADEGDGCNSRTNVCENFMKQANRDMDVPVNGCMVSQVFFGYSEFECKARCQDMDQQSVGGHRTKTRCNPKTLANPVTEDQSVISSSNTIVIKMDPVNNDSGNAEYELPPFTFVGVSPVLVKSEVLGDQESESSVTDPLMKNTLEAHPDDSNASEVKNVKEENNQTKVAVKQEIEASEIGLKITGNGSILKEIKSVSDSCVVSSSNEMKHSCDESITNVEENMILATEHMGDVHSNQNKPSDGAVSSLRSKDCSLRNNRALEVKFESICEPDLKEEKLFLRGEEVECIEDDDESLSLKQGNEESSCKNSMQHVNSGVDVTTAKELKLKKAVVVLQRIQLPYELRAGGDQSAANETYRSSIKQQVSSEMEKELKECSGNKESFNHSHCDAVPTSNEKTTHVPSHAVNKDHSGSSKTYVKHNGDLTSKESFSCEVCDASFRYQCHLKSHKRIHTCEKPFKCGECDVSFKRKSHLKEHMTIHTGEKPFKCGVCDVSFRQRGDLNKHMKIHTGEKPFKCDVCKASFRVKETRNEHMKIHTGEKPFKCGECKASFRHSGSLYAHKRLHTGEKPFKCGECKATFRYSRSLKIHKRLHTAENPFKCGECYVLLGAKSTLDRHMRIHTAEKPLKCGFCGVLFSQKSNLNNHMKFHTGDKPFECDVCKASFRAKGSLYKHVKIHTGGKPFKCGK